MKFKQYFKVAEETAIFDKNVGHAYLAMGLAGESGEVLEHFKKSIRNGFRDGRADLDPARLDAVKDELGDVMWYWVVLVKELGLDPEEIFQHNIDKLTKRYK